ncbi:hypothetical protein SEVIR_5G366801v4 [Setaria viridis]
MSIWLLLLGSSHFLSRCLKHLVASRRYFCSVKMEMDIIPLTL